MPKGAAAVAIVGLVAGALVVARPAAAQSDLDAFMEKVLARRDENWKKLQQYVLDEHERIDVRGPGNLPVWGEIRDYTWYLREGLFVRSPVKVNGVAVAEADRRTYEEQYVQRVKARDRPQPQFIDSAYFLKFKFERSKYALVGRESFEGREVLRIEYYPTHLFRHEQELQERRREEGLTDERRDRRAAVERMANKAALVTIWVEPASHQIVKYTLDNVTMEFLPAAWLVHMDDAKATMTMSQPMPDVWLPREVTMFVSGTLAVGSFDVRYRLEYENYRKAETSSRFRIGKGP